MKEGRAKSNVKNVSGGRKSPPPSAPKPKNKISREGVKEILSKKYPQYPGFIDHTLVWEMCQYFADHQTKSLKKENKELKKILDNFKFTIINSVYGKARTELAIKIEKLIK
jgi:hypothetical protein